MKTLLLGLLGITVAGFGCSGTVADGTGGTGGSGGTSAAPLAQGQAQPAGCPPPGANPRPAVRLAVAAARRTRVERPAPVGRQPARAVPAREVAAPEAPAPEALRRAAQAPAVAAPGAGAAAQVTEAPAEARAAWQARPAAAGVAPHRAELAGEEAAGASGGGTCTASQRASRTVTGTGPHDVVIETNSAQGIRCGTIYRPADLGGAEKYPILVWGEGGCSQDGYSNPAAMGEIASWGYLVVADGTPGGTGACAGGQSGAAFLDYITWAIAENGKSCSAYYQSLETTKIAADGFSCGGLMAENVSGDPRFAAIGITSSGLMGANSALYDKIHTPFKIMNGGSSDIAYENGLRDYQQISSRGKPIVYFSKTSAGHGGDLGQARGDFNRVNLAWLNWQLKGDMGATGKGFLNGSTCQFCTNAGWDYMSANIQ